MQDAIPGARYYDSVFDEEFVCNGTAIVDGERVVVLEYEFGVLRVPHRLFREDETIELRTLP